MALPSVQQVPLYHKFIERQKKSITLKGPDACIDSYAATAFFSRSDVQEAYHVKPPNGAGDDWEFGVCTVRHIIPLEQLTPISFPAGAAILWNVLRDDVPLFVSFLPSFHSPSDGGWMGL